MPNNRPDFNNPIFAMPPVMAETQYLPWRHRSAFLNVGLERIRILYQLMRPQTMEVAYAVGRIVIYVRHVRDEWRAFQQANFYHQPRMLEGLMGQNYAYTPWTIPSIEDFSAVLEVLLHCYANDMLIAVMGHHWYDQD